MINASGINTTAINAPATQGGAGAIIELVRESAHVYGIANTATEIDLIRDSAIVTDDYDLVYTQVVRDGAVATDSHDIIRTARLTLSESAVVTSTTYEQTIVTWDVSETAVVLGAAESVTPDIDVLEVAVVTGDASYSLTVRYVVRETAQLSDAASYGGTTAVTDSLVASDTAYPRTIVRYVVRDSALILGFDANDLAQDLLIDVLETAVALGYATNRLIARLDVHDTAYTSDSMVSWDGLEGTSGLPADSVWTASVASWGMSRHSGDNITQRGTRFAVSPDGLFEIGADYSNAEVDTGFMGLGTKALKHVSTIYLQGSRDGDLVVAVTADRNNVRAINSYTPIARAHEDSRSVRVDIGRGYRSTYYKLQIQTTGRVELFGGGLLVANTQRRI